jgi:hypothetical protein
MEVVEIDGRSWQNFSAKMAKSNILLCNEHYFIASGMIIWLHNSEEHILLTSLRPKSNLRLLKIFAFLKGAELPRISLRQ